MKYKVIFSLLLITIIFIGIKGVDITGFFFNDNSIEERVVPRDSVNTGAIYIASPNEISFNPMEVVEGKRIISMSNDAASVCLALVKFMSKYSEETTFESSVSAGMRESFLSSENDYYYLDKFAYYNPEHEIRYVDCIISHYDYRIVYINFYDEEEYTLESDDIDQGIEIFRRNSEKYYLNLSEHIEKINELLSSYAPAYYTNPPIMDLSYLNNTYDFFSDFFAETYNSKYYSSNSIEYFWDRSIIPCQIYFNDKWDVTDEYIETYYTNYGEEYIEETYENAASSTVNIIYAICNYGNEYDSGVTADLVDNIEYIANNGRIYQTIKFQPGYYYMNSVIVIYNIKKDSIEGFYAPPNDM